MHHINHNIKWFREHKRITQQELADQLDTTLGRIKTYELGTATPPLELMLTISDMMDITLDSLVRVQMDEMIYRAAKKEKVKERGFFDDLISINSRLDKVEKALKQKLKQQS